MENDSLNINPSNLTNYQLEAQNFFYDSVLKNIDKSQTPNYLLDEDCPPSSPWHNLCSSHLPFWKFDEQSIIRINFTREVFSPYYFCHLFLIFLYTYFCYHISPKVFPNDPFYHDLIFYTITFFSTMSHITYIITHFTNPGILPYYWSTTKQRVYTTDELRSGFAINHQQKKWGKEHDWPTRSFFAGDYGAIILRADHYCIWLSHWIGLRNLKFYIQSLVYCTLFIFDYLYAMTKVYQSTEKVGVFFIVLFIVMVYFAYVHIINLALGFFHIAINCTAVEALSLKVNRFHDKGIIRNFEEVFGPIFLFPLWFLPVMIPLPNDGFNYPMRPNDYCLAINRNRESI